jgi:hypothetical protein
MKKMFSATTLIITGATYIVLICLAAIWYFMSLGFSFANASQKICTTFDIMIAVLMILTLIAGIVIIAVQTKSTPFLNVIGYLILTVGVWILIWSSVTIWNSTLGIRQDLLYKKVTAKGELVFDYHYDFGDHDETIDRHDQYYYMGEKVYIIKKEDDFFIRVVALSEIKKIDTSYYFEVYQKKNKYTLLFREGIANTIDGVYYPDYLIYLNDIGFFQFFIIHNIAKTEHAFNDLDLIVLNEEIHAKFKEEWNR